MKTNSRLFPLLSVALLLGSCSESLTTDGQGSLALKPRISCETTQSRAAEGEDQLYESLMVWISNSKGLIRRYNTAAEIPASIQLKSGNYVVEGWAGDSVAASFTTRFFKGRQDVEITPGATSTAELVCRIANAVVTVEYLPEVAEMLSDIEFTVSNEGGSITFEGNDTRKGYFMMGRRETVLTYLLSGTDVDGKAYTQEGTIDNVAGGVEYHLKVGASSGVSTSGSGAAFFDVAVDTSCVDEETEILITLSPRIAGVDFNIGEVQAKGLGECSDMSMTVHASSALTSVSLSSESLTAAFGATSFDLMTMSPAQIQSLNKGGVTWSYSANEATETSRFELTLDADLLNSLGGGEHSITLSATDANEKTSTASLNLTLGSVPVKTLEIAECDVWATHTRLLGLSTDGQKGNYSFRYRVQGTSSWTVVPATVDGTSLYADLTGLKPGTTYEYSAVLDDFNASVRTFTTEQALALPNGDFETWSTSGKVLLMAPSADSRFWDTGNHGSSTMNVNVTQNCSDPKHGGQYSAKLSSQFVGIGSIGKFAAGNAFVGQYLKTDGTDGELGMGRPFAARPSALKGYVRYEPGTVAYTSSSVPGLAKGDSDLGVIYVAIIADEDIPTYTDGSKWPFIIKTKSKELFDSTARRVIGFGELKLTEATAGSGLVEFTIPIEYRRTDVKAAYLMLVCSASYYGDYFAGGPSTMYIDDFSFEY